MLKPLSLNHVAYPTFDTGATYRFYTEVLGCEFVGAVQKDEVPSTGEPTPFLHTFFAMASGECIAFFEVDGLKRGQDDGIPAWIRHIALNVESEDAVMELKDRLESFGVEVIGVVDHEGRWSSVYFFDPNGVRLELTYQATPLDDEDAREGLVHVEHWAKARGQSLTGSPVNA